MGGQITGYGKTTIRLAAIQASALSGQIAANLKHAEGLMEQVAGQGATVVVLPELFSCGYVPNRDVWDLAEARGGRTDRWLAATARRLGIYLGAGAAETDGTDFFNVFTLAAPDGQIAGRACKANAEASVFRRGRSAHVIDTRVGRIGVGICADNQFAVMLRLMHEQQADLILMPHAWPTPARAAGLVSQADVAAQQQRMTELPVLYA
jgi:N-carbamoylputrescine amidase